ncbi:Orotidine 5'-phosphate decarboxylase domain-containing protein [Tirmania nivea]|nr:Orotidine 5'-phosphate decarboxylase domain-containing protein [Tirmania nivea]
MSTRSYASRAETHPTAIGRHLLSVISSKRTNLCLSIDVTSPPRALEIVRTLAPKICLVKTHIDILAFPADAALSIAQFTRALTSLAKQHNFLIFEDRKFADIGNTVSHQYGGGVYRIADWAHITNAHSLPGEGIIQGLQKVADALPLSPQGQPQDSARGLLLLEEMSSAGNLFNSAGYRSSTLDMARRNKNFVMGFIAMGKVGEEREGEDWIIMTPGVNIASTGDALGQQYKTPEHVIGERGSDVIIVGRGIYGSEDMLGAAEEYRRRGWEAYERRVKV